MKKEDRYHFSIPFEYIEKNHGNDNYDIATAYMECDVEWDDLNEGYTCHYSCSDESDIDPEEGNGSLDDFYEEQVIPALQDALEEEGIGITDLCLDMI